MFQDPPNFLIQSDFSKHVKPVAVVPEPEPDRDSHTPEPEIVENLIDTEPLQVCITYYPIRF